MADAALGFLLQNLQQLLNDKIKPIYGVEEQVGFLYDELSLLKAFLKESAEKRSESDIFKELVRQIRDVVYEAEVVIDRYVSHIHMERARGYISKLVHGIDPPRKRRKVVEEIESIRKNVDEIYRKKSFGFEVMQHGEPSSRDSSEKKPPVVEEENVVGFDEEAKTLVDRLKGGKEELEVISVTGMGGLGIRGKLATLMKEKGGSTLFDNLTKLDRLVTLKLLNDTFPDRPSKCSLPQLYKFPPNLKELTLADTLLDWEHMSTLGLLPKLEVLKLKDKAFQGNRWKAIDGGFRLLRFLQIGKTDLVHWEASGHHFPRLQQLILKYCESLEALLSGLGDVSSLRIIDLYHASSTAAASAKKITKQKQDLATSQF
ncbi:putative disease resistance RPP13-like protein 3 [Camellia lanceoleosa]|uniref:Disease resistance RPP13-like protein 3 n=1 Tax=Camellia lanceoleosa TaxID=1840588 RepID=A0ACC0FXX0_9ERIC|nr:putative disease resistance RPP13-like protein 3 [Camellia lanceoleosa]